MSAKQKILNKRNQLSKIKDFQSPSPGGDLGEARLSKSSPLEGI